MWTSLTDPSRSCSFQLWDERGGPSLWRDHSAHMQVRPTSWGIWVFSTSLSSWIIGHCFGLWGVVWQHGVCLSWLHLVTVICWEVLSMRFQIFRAGCLLFAFCYVWMSPDCVYPRCGQLNRIGHPVSCVPAWSVIPVQGSWSPRLWRQKVLIRWTDTSDPAITVWYLFCVKGKLKDCVSFLLPMFWYVPEPPNVIFFWMVRFSVIWIN